MRAAVRRALTSAGEPPFADTLPSTRSPVQNGRVTTTDDFPTLRADDLGAPIAEGRTAQVFGRGEAEVVRVLRPGFVDRIGELILRELTGDPAR